MGAAWALEKRCISILLPDSNFNSLGWLTSFQKAVKINDNTQLASLCQSIAQRLSIDLSTRFTALNSKIDEFVRSLNTKKNPKATTKEIEIDTIAKGSLKLFDLSLMSICLEEGKYVLQMNLRIRSESESASIKRIILRNKDNFTGSVSNPRNELVFVTYIQQGLFDLVQEQFKAEFFVKVDYPKSCKQVLDLVASPGQNLSMSFVQLFYTIRESDGFDELQLGGWEVVVEYNVEDVVVSPLKLLPVDKDSRGKYWHNNPI